MNILIKRAIFLLIVALLLTSVRAQQPAQSPARSREEQELINARRSHEEAQTEYYREQTKKLREPPKTFWQGVWDNPSALGAIVAALFAAVVGLMTLFVNTRASLRVQRDNQFYEALKRFGDKDSPSLRSSASGILSQMASIELRELDLFRLKNTYKAKRPYLVTARNQLVAGLLFEENLTAKRYLEDAIRTIVDLEPVGAAEHLLSVNRALQPRLRRAIARFLIFMGAETPDNIPEAVWDKLSYVPEYDLSDWQCLARDDRRKFEAIFNRTLIEYHALNESDRKTGVANNITQLNAAASSMNLDVGILSYALRNRKHRERPVITTPPIFLVNADLKDADLTSSNLQRSFLMRAQLQRANLSEAQLQLANLSKAHLQGARLNNADMNGTVLSGIEIDDQTDFSNTKWWKAHFKFDTNYSSTEKLLESLYQRYHASVPQNLDEVHESIRQFISDKRTPEGNNISSR
jgi:hypothetical protein